MRCGGTASSSRNSWFAYADGAKDCSLEDAEVKFRDQVVVGAKDSNVRRAVANEFENEEVQEIVNGVALSESAATSAP